MDLVAWIDGRLVDARQATVSVYDVGFRSGHGVFETMRAFGDHVFRLDAHLQRAVEGATELGFELDVAVLRDAVHTTVDANLRALDGADSAVRLTTSAGTLDPFSDFPGARATGPTVVVTSHPLAAAPTRATAVSIPVTRDLPHVKATSYLSALTAGRRAREQGADEALLTTPDGQVLEGASSNLFLVVDGRLRTPPVVDGLLAGITRRVVLDLAQDLGVDVDESSFDLSTLRAADEAFVTASTRGVVPLVGVDGIPIGDGEPGPVTGRLRQAYDDEVARERAGGDRERP